jgi:hypothetical protein
MSAGKRGPPKTEAETVKEPLEPEIIEETTVEAETPSGPAELGERLRLQRENTAQMLALFVVGIFGMVSLLIIVCGFGASLIAFLVATSQGTGGVAPPTFDALEAAKILLPYLATPLGVAMGYYFTRQAAEQKK